MNVVLVYINNECNIGRGVGYVAGAIMQVGHKLTFFDTFFTRIETVVDKVVSGNYDLLMVSTMTMLFPESVRLTRLIKKRVNIPILLGGIHPTIVGGQILEENPEIDYLCIGEGESMVVEFLEHFGRPSMFSVSNLAFRRDDGAIQVNPIRPAEDLSKLPPFPWHLFPNQAVVQGEQGFLYVNASRGCPFNCSYCCNNVYLKLYHKSYLRFRPVEHIIDELKFLQDTYAPSLFYFGDEMIFSDPEYTLKLFRTIRQELDITYGCMARVEYMTPEIVQELAETGCQYIGMGIECGNEEFRRKHLTRRMSNTQIEHAFGLLKRAGIFVTSFNMVGYPFEFDDRLTEETVKLNQRIHPDFAQISIFYPFPGTRLYQRCLDLDLIDHEKQITTKHYFDESVLKGVSLRDKKKDLDALLNPEGFQFHLREHTRNSHGSMPVEPRAPKTSVLMISYDHLVIDRRILQQARSLARAGYKVTVVSGFECPNEQHYIDDGVTVHRYCYNPGEVYGHEHVELGRFKKAGQMLRNVFSRLWQILNKQKFSESFLQHIYFNNQDYRSFVWHTLLQFRADVVHVHDLPLLWLGAELAKKWDARLVFDAHEIYYAQQVLSPSQQKMLARQERRTLPKVDVFITVNDAIADYFHSIYGKRPLVLLNCTDTPPEGLLRGSREILRAKSGIPSDATVVLYQGWFSDERNLLTMVQAVEQFRDDAYLVLIGYGEYEKKLREVFQGKHWEKKIRFIGQIDSKEILTYTAGADLGIIPYQAIDLNHKLCSPNKFFEYVQVGVPVVAQDLVFFREMEERYGVVAVGDLSTVSGMAMTVNDLLNHPERLESMRSACHAAAKVLNWETESRKLLKAYGNLVYKHPLAT